MINCHPQRDVITKEYIILIHQFWYAVAQLVEALCYKPVTGLIPNGVNGIFHSLNPAGHIMALESTQPQ